MNFDDMFSRLDTQKNGNARTISHYVWAWHAHARYQHASFFEMGFISLWRPLLPYGYSYKANLSVRVSGCQKLLMTA